MQWVTTFDSRALNKDPTIRAMARRIQEDRNSAEPDRVKLLSTWATDLSVNSSIV